MREHLVGPARLLAGTHNARLGPAIHVFNIPPEPAICIGASPRCAADCYAKTFLFRLQDGRHRRNHERSRQDDFARALIAEIGRELVRIVRIHVAGDFYDAAYVAKWARVARACPGTTFFAYTRSWRREAALAALTELSRLPNVWLWFSEDRETGRSPAVPGIRRAYLLGVAEPEGSIPPDADLLFRVPLPRRPGRPNAYPRPAKRIHGVLVCPKEQGIDRTVAMTCSRCRICFTDRRTLSASPWPDPGRSEGLVPSIPPANPGGPP
jgi:hypothetical protein